MVPSTLEDDFSDGLCGNQAFLATNESKMAMDRRNPRRGVRVGGSASKRKSPNRSSGPEARFKSHASCGAIIPDYSGITSLKPSVALDLKPSVALDGVSVLVIPRFYIGCSDCYASMVIALMTDFIMDSNSLFSGLDELVAPPGTVLVHDNLFEVTPWLKLRLELSFDLLDGFCATEVGPQVLQLSEEYSSFGLYHDLVGCGRMKIHSDVVFALCATRELMLRWNLPHTNLSWLDCYELLFQQSLHQSLLFPQPRCFFTPLSIMWNQDFFCLCQRSVCKAVSYWLEHCGLLLSYRW